MRSQLSVDTTFAPIHRQLHGCRTGATLSETTAHHGLNFCCSSGDGDDGSGDGYSGDGKLMGYIDPDWANDRHDRNSQGGHVFIAGGGALSRQSQKQHPVAMSTEYMPRSLSGGKMAAATATRYQESTGWPYRRTVTHIRRFAGSLDTHHHRNYQGARTEHIDECYHINRDLHARVIVRYDYINTNDNPADTLTKALAKDKHEKFSRAIGVW